MALCHSEDGSITSSSDVSYLMQNVSCTGRGSHNVCHEMKNVAFFKTKNAFFYLLIFWINNVNMFQRFNTVTLISIPTCKAYETELVILGLCTMSSAVHDLTLSLLRLVLLPGYYFQ